MKIKQEMAVKVRNLTFDTIIGLLPIEREKPQRVVVNCTLYYQCKSDVFIDYSLVKDYLITTIQRKQFKKLEEGVVFLTQGLKDLFPIIYRSEIEIIKPHIFDNCNVSLCLTQKFKI
ncbi:MAG: dihydroneopterin aldolase [Helicobacter sp.]|nr:dihydroneopterin aldolase [Helicobacter sp.]MBD5168417.1 dihydroneopterin aldolase [Helicobacter sp.]MDE5817025.1 dihydroneopterin aldolase [Helicobacter sp.]MDE6043978.1 dihydroneopterin aldolase [Helicobacter sp.]MDE7195773.1 dihydroneopterin aldolase [Helicobacter sp.]